MAQLFWHHAKDRDTKDTKDTKDNDKDNEKDVSYSYPLNLTPNLTLHGLS
jgi:hypothetical protein